MREDLVSVIVPAHNAASTIEATLASILAQTHTALEVVVIDDGSTDGTGARVVAMARQDARIRYVYQSNAGVAAARNAGIAISSGAYIAPMDADDIWHPTKIEKQLALLTAAGPEVGVVYCYTRLIDKADQVVETLPPGQRTGDVFTTLLLSNFIRSASIPLIRRRELEAVGGYDRSLRERGAQGCEDLKLYLMLAERCRFELCPEYLVGYRVSRSGMSANAVLMQRSWLMVMEEVKARHPEIPVWLFNWAAGNFHRWLGFNTLSYGQVGTGLTLLARSAVEDPATLRPGMLATLVEILTARLAQRLGVKPVLSRCADRLRGRIRRPLAHFGDMDPACLDGGLPEAWENHRQAVAKAVHCTPPADGADGISPTAPSRSVRTRRKRSA